ncbi:DISARM system SNF2-like helicase DrmD [Frankia sp. R82]|uniref:DISARM system SNF2-like helicase DrmD n=1 Tax=Frankia sp. R82 TaxID=2950553 RepID=UPI0020431619|nr:DISARM system SNF2-like helicase DrmD [Frankia sp. R82]MCM3882900.1 DISARM system SNF2-like helicase DrmD [Frankia sp. R82]
MTVSASLRPDAVTGGAAPAVPEQGQVVEVRGSTWAVALVAEQGLPRSPGDEEVAGLNHVVTLQALDEDRLGEELTVVWELEVGHTITPDQGLPTSLNADGFDDPNLLAGFVDAMRWGAVTSADDRSFQAPFRSGVSVEAYQLEPLRRALSSARTNLLLADDVGLGKTVEAGLVIQELLLRHRARTAIVVCPPSLALKWQDEMRDKFGLDFTIINSERLRDVRRAYGLHANPFLLFPRVIVSLAWLPGVRAQRMLRDVYGQTTQINSAKRFAFDILVVDEAHHVAPASPSVVGGGRGYAVDTQRTEAVRGLANRCEHRLFLSATPHNGHPESFTALMEMIDSRRFSRGAQLDESALRDVTVRRLKSDLPHKDFQRRQFRALPVQPDPGEQEMFALLARILHDSARANGRGPSGDITTMLFKKRFLSSPWAFTTTLEQYLAAQVTGQGLADPDYDDILGEGQADEEEGLWEQQEASHIRASKSTDPLVAARPGELEQLAAWGRGYESRPDARLDALMVELDAICRPAGTWSNERVVVFSEYADTIDWAHRVLSQFGYADVLAVIQGSTPPEEREVIRARFTADPAQEKVRVLLATDAAGEGIDLQWYCHRLVNLDVPFNPSRLEQRIGRIDRWGQTRRPEIFYFAPPASSETYGADLAFMGMIARKVATIASDLGSVNQLISTEIQEHFTGRAPARRRRDPVDGNAVINRALKGGMDLNAQLTALERGYGEERARLHLTPENLRRVVDTALRIDHQPPLVETGDQDTDAAVFTVPQLSPAWQPALTGLDTVLTPGQLRPITFDEEAGALHHLVHVHLGHPLVTRAQRLLRRSLWSADAPLNRVSAVVVPDLPESFVAAVTRMVLVGRGGLRLHEEVFLAGVRLRGRRAMAEERAERHLDQALDATDLRLADAEIRTALTDTWNAPDSPLRTRLLESMTTRADAYHRRVSDQLARREESDIRRVQGIYKAFARNLTESLEQLTTAEMEAELALFPDDQQRQRRRDIQAMRERLESLAGEETREVATISQRYEEVKPHISAAAVVFALTEADAAQAGSW